MSAERLREAATLMRSRALEATGGAWSAYGGTAAPVHVRSRWTDDQGRRCTGVVAEAHGARSESRAQDATHIASWHPAVALAVADWLDSEADDLDAYARDEQMPFNPDRCRRALAVADAYLGADS